MSDNLRAALGEAWDDGNATGLDGYVGPGRGAGEVDPEAELARARVLDKLLAQIAEPAPVVTDEAVQRALDVFVEHRVDTKESRMRAALEAAAPLLGPRPLLDREAALQAIVAVSVPEGSDNIMGREYVENYADVFADAVILLGRPMPTREQIETTVRKTIFAYFGTYERPVELITDDVTALLNGAES